MYLPFVCKLVCIGLHGLINHSLDKGLGNSERKFGKLFQLLPFIGCDKCLEVFLDYRKAFALEDRAAMDVRENQRFDGVCRSEVADENSFAYILQRF